MRAILIDGIARTVSAIEVQSDDWQSFAKVLGCSYVDRIPLTSREDLWIDDEGRFSYPNPRGYFVIGGMTICGRGVILGHDGNGSSVDSLASLDTVRRVVEWCGTPGESEVAPRIEIVVNPDEVVS